MKRDYEVEVITDLLTELCKKYNIPMNKDDQTTTNLQTK